MSGFAWIVSVVFTSGVFSFKLRFTSLLVKKVVWLVRFRSPGPRSNDAPLTLDWRRHPLRTRWTAMVHGRQNFLFTHRSRRSGLREEQGGGPAGDALRYRTQVKLTVLEASSASAVPAG